jgi:hypothetical protein
VRLQISGVARVGSTPDGKTILEVAGRPAFELNGIAAAIWAKLVAGFSAEDIKSHLITEYGAPEELVARDVAKFIDKLKHYLLVYDDN